MDEIMLNAFPKNKAEALAMLYVQSQDITDLSPTALLAMYDTAYDEICERLNEQYDSRFKQI